MSGLGRGRVPEDLRERIESGYLTEEDLAVAREELERIEQSNKDVLKVLAVAIKESQERETQRLTNMDKLLAQLRSKLESHEHDEEDSELVARLNELDHRLDTITEPPEWAKELFELKVKNLRLLAWALPVYLILALVMSFT